MPVELCFINAIYKFTQILSIAIIFSVFAQIICYNFGPQSMRSLRRYYSYVLRIKSIFFTMNIVAKTTSFHCNKKSNLWCDMNESMAFFNMSCLLFREHYYNHYVHLLYKLRLIDIHL